MAAATRGRPFQTSRGREVHHVDSFPIAAEMSGGIVESRAPESEED
jgi:hypothetical protein